MSGYKIIYCRASASLAVVGLCLYAPFSWLLLIDYPWGSGYRIFWLKLWPILPGFLAGFLPGPLLFHRHLPYEFHTMGVTTVILLAGLTWLGSSRQRRLVTAALLALLVSVISATIAYGVFRSG